jgi:16S rRNA processing protein RimM
MGRIGAPHGVKGWVKIVPFAESPGALATHRRWWIGRTGDWTVAEVGETQLQGTRLLVRMAGCGDRDAADRLRGREIALPRDELPEAGPGEYYWADLIGLDVVNAQGANLGQVASVFSVGPHDVLRVGEAARERLLPFVATVIRAVDLPRRRIEVDWGPDW